MTRFLLGSLRRTSSLFTTAAPQTLAQNPTHLFPIRTFAEVADAERRLRFVPLPDSTFADSQGLLRTTDQKIALNRPDGDLCSKDAANARESAFSELGLTVFACNSVLNSLRSAKRYEDTVSLFNYYFALSGMIIPNCNSYDILISTYCDMGNADIALEVFRHVMRTIPLRPLACSYCYLTKGLVGAGLVHEAIDLRREYKGTYECITKVLVDAGRIDEAMDVLSEMLKENVDLRKELQAYGDRPDPLVSNFLVYGNLILGFLNLGNLEKAKDLFNDFKKRNPKKDDFDSTGVVTTTFMNWFVEQGRKKGAIESYKFLLDIPDKNASLIEELDMNASLIEKLDMNGSLIEADTFNEILEVFIEHGQRAEAGALFAQLFYDRSRK